MHSSLTFDGMFLNHAKAILCVVLHGHQIRLFFAFGYEVYIPMLTPTLCQMLTFKYTLHRLTHIGTHFVAIVLLLKSKVEYGNGFPLIT